MIKPRRRTIAMLRTNGGDHPCVFLTDPVKLKGKGRAKILYVPLSTSQRGRDTACEFKTSPDRRILAGSFSYYARAEIIEVADVDAELRRRGRRLSEITMEAYMRIIAGMEESKLMPEQELEFYYRARRQGKAG